MFVFSVLLLCYQMDFQKTVSIEEYNELNKKYNELQKYCDNFNFIHQTDIDKIILLTKEETQKHKLTVIENMFRRFGTEIFFRVRDEIKTECLDLSEDQQEEVVNHVIRIIHILLNDIVGGFNEREEHEKQNEILKLIERKKTTKTLGYKKFKFQSSDIDYEEILKNITKEKDEKINELQNQLKELQHNSAELLEKINKMLE